MQIMARAPDEFSYPYGGYEIPASEVEFEVSIENQRVASIDCLYAESLSRFRQVTWSGDELECVNWPEWTE